MMMYGWVIGLVLLVILIVVLNKKGRLFQKNRGNISDTNSEKSSLEVLKKRYAEGEIDKDEFNEKKVELKETD